MQATTYTLPDGSETRLERHPMRFATRSIPALVDMLADSGSPKNRLVAKMAGGSAMFGSGSATVAIGDRNVAQAKAELRRLHIPLRAEDTGMRHARTIELHLDTGILLVRSYVYGIREI